MPWIRGEGRTRGKKLRARLGKGKAHRVKVYKIYWIGPPRSKDRIQRGASPLPRPKPKEKLGQKIRRVNTGVETIKKMT